MQDSDTTIAQLKEIVKKHCDERDWDQYHNPKDLAIGVSIEASELLEHFIYKSEKEMKEMLEDPNKRKEISEEMSDTLYYIIRIAQMNDIDLARAFDEKMEQNRKKYPIEKSRGSNKKYNEL
jgi:NTP pyrophosphatase (non-canonical NTP hydrolase)